MTLFIGKNCIEVEKTDSTNSYLSRLLNDDSSALLQDKKENKLPEGTIVITKHQQAGRGQRGTIWESEPNKNLTFSILLRPTFLKPDEQFMLNKVVAMGVMEFVTSSLDSISPWKQNEREVKIKWANDIYVGNKKVAGILIENSVSGNQLQQSIIGIGINVNQKKFSAELPNPVSFKLITNKEFDLKECLFQLCSFIEKRYLQLKANHFEKINKDYLNALYCFEEWKNYKYKGEFLLAKITGITKVGKLMLETKRGKFLECNFKEVEFF
ncbi:MAG: biotin--[acetyl-CoA-carboxylase] ligase [Bacteroidota bacterium]